MDIDGDGQISEEEETNLAEKLVADAGSYDLLLNFGVIGALFASVLLSSIIQPLERMSC